VLEADIEIPHTDSLRARLTTVADGMRSRMWRVLGICHYMDLWEGRPRKSAKGAAALVAVSWILILGMSAPCPSLRNGRAGNRVLPNAADRFMAFAKGISRMIAVYFARRHTWSSAPTFQRWKAAAKEKRRSPRGAEKAPDAVKTHHGPLIFAARQHGGDIDGGAWKCLCRFRNGHVALFIVLWLVSTSGR